MDIWFVVLVDDQGMNNGYIKRHSQVVRYEDMRQKPWKLAEIEVQSIWKEGGEPSKFKYLGDLISEDDRSEAEN